MAKITKNGITINVENEVNYNKIGGTSVWEVLRRFSGKETRIQSFWIDGGTITIRTKVNVIIIDGDTGGIEIKPQGFVSKMIEDTDLSNQKYKK